jgi:hypothetical protein
LSPGKSTVINFDTSPPFPLDHIKVTDLINVKLKGV